MESAKYKDSLWNLTLKYNQLAQEDTELPFKRRTKKEKFSN